MATWWWASTGCKTAEGTTAQLEIQLWIDFTWFHHISQLEEHRNSLALSQEHLAFQDKVFEGISHQHLRNRTSFTIHCYSMLQYLTIYCNVSRVFGIHRFKFQHCTARHVGHFPWVSWSGVETVRPSCRGSASFGGLASGTCEKTNLMVI